MKCPECKYNCSNLRDICPRCLKDLRPFKTKKNLPVVDANISYEDLVGKQKDKIKVKKVIEKTDSIFSFFKKTESPEASENLEQSETEQVMPATSLEDVTNRVENSQNETEEEITTDLVALEFIEVSRELENVEPSTEDVELSQELFQSPSSREQVNLLFDMAADAIEDPEKDGDYVEYESFTKKSEIKSERLSALLKKTEEALSAPVLNLKALGRKRKASRAPKKDIVLETASASQVSLALLYDLIVIALCAVILSLAYLSSTRADLQNEILSLDYWASLQDLSIYGVLLSSVIVSAVFYPFFSCCLISRTIGQELVHLKVLTLHKKKPELFNILIRSFSLPLAALFFLNIQVLFGKRSIQDYLADTIVTEEK